MLTVVVGAICFGTGAAIAWMIRGRRAARDLIQAQNATDDAFCRLIDNEVREIRTETGRSESLLRDAVDKLNTSFSEMVNSTRKQGDMIVGLVEPGLGSPGVRKFAEQAGAQIRELAAVLEHAGRDNVNVVRSMTDTVGSLGRLFAEVDAFASVANPATLARMRELIGGARTSLMRTRDMIEESAENSMNAAVAAQLRADLLVNDVHTINRALADGMQVVAQCSEHIRDSVSLLVRSLQFEDITNQSLGAANRHLERLQDLGREAARLLPVGAATAEDRLRALQEFGAYLRLVQAGTVKAVPRSVSQTDLGTGAVDLF